MIPKKIHYCWFGRNPMPQIILKCIESWKLFLPDYEHLLWNEDNYDVNKIAYTSDAYKWKKYAFVSDYARFDILNKQGGIYLDTDVELLKSLNPLLENKAFTGFEKHDLVAPGLILGAVPGHPVIAYMKSYYEKQKGFHPEKNMETVVAIMTNYLTEKGLTPNNTYQVISDMVIYPTEYFAPMNFQNNKVTITDKTFSIHHYAGSWLSSTEIVKIKIYQYLNNALGEKYFLKLRNLLKK